MEVIYRKYIIHCRACVGLLIHILYARVDLCFAVHKLENISSNTGRAHFEGFVHLLRFIRDNKNLGLGYYSKIEYALISKLLVQASINNYKKLMVLSDYSWHGCPDTGRSTGAYIVFYQGGQFIIAHMLQVQFPNLVIKVSLMQHAQKEFL